MLIEDDAAGREGVEGERLGPAVAVGADGAGLQPAEVEDE